MNNVVEYADDVFHVNDANYIHSQFETICINNKEVNSWLTQERQSLYYQLKYLTR